MKRSAMPPRKTPMSRTTLARKPIGKVSSSPSPMRPAPKVLKPGVISLAESMRLYPAACARVDRRSGGRCEAMFSPKCSGRVEHHHHRRRRRWDRLHLTLMGSCLECHSRIHFGEVAEAKALGLLLPSFDVSGFDPWTPPSERVAA